MKNRKPNKNYKITIYKYDQSVKGDLTNFWIEKFNIDSLDEIDKIDELNLKNFKELKCFDFDNSMYGRLQDIFDGTVDQENFNIIFEGDIDYDATRMKTIQNTRFVVKMSEVQLFSAGDSSEINEIPEIFFNKKNLVIIKNMNDNKCLLWTYIRKHLNPIEKNISRVNKNDIEIAVELINEHDVDFKNISLDEINEIEDLLECNIHIFGCNKKFESKKLLKNL